VMVLRRDMGLGWIWVAKGGGFGRGMDCRREMVCGWEIGLGRVMGLGMEIDWE